MSAWLSSNFSAHSVGFAASLATGLRAIHGKAVSLTRPPSLRRARERAVRVITVIAGH